jgi:hypothetical protein
VWLDQNEASLPIVRGQGRRRRLHRRVRVPRSLHPEQGGRGHVGGGQTRAPAAARPGQGPILRNLISAEKFLDKVFTLDFRTNYLLKTADKCVFDYLGHHGCMLQKTTKTNIYKLMYIIFIYIISIFDHF